MRIAHVVPHVGNEASGPTYSVVRLAQSLSCLGEEVLLLSVKDGQLPDQLRFRHRVYPKSRLPSSLWRSPALLHALRTAALQSDVIHSHGMWVMPAVYAGWVAGGGRVPLVISPRGCLSPTALSRSAMKKRVVWWALHRRGFIAADCLHATSEQEYQDIRAAGLRNPVTVIPNGIDLHEAYTERPGDDRLRTLLSLRSRSELVQAFDSTSGHHHRTGWVSSQHCLK